MKKLLSATLLVILMLTALSACGKPASAATLGLGTDVSQLGTDAGPTAPAVGSIAVTVAAVIMADGKILNAAVETFIGDYTVSDRGIYAANASPVASSVDASALVGKTKSEIDSMTTLLSSVKAAVLSAIGDATANGAPVCKKTDRVGLAAIGKASGKNADFYIGDGMNGSASLDATYAAVATGTDGRVTAASLDAVQISRSFDANGKHGDAKPILTKRELGYDYGMKGVSASFGIGLEWFEQASGFCSYLVGKTASEIGAISVSESGKATDAALLSSCTITIFDFISAAKTAAGKAN